MIAVYLLFATQLYFVCEWLKTTSYIPKNTHHMNNCIRVFKPYLTQKELYDVCDQLNYQSNFHVFINNLVYMNLCVYVLLREWFVSCTYLYWCIVYSSAIVYSLLGNFQLFQWSISSTSHTTFHQTLLFFILSCFIISLIVWQWYYKRIQYRLLTMPLIMYGSVFLLFRTVTSEIKYHFHHALVVGTISLCFTDFNIRMNRWVHAVCMGIFVQGLNFYTIEEIFLFYTGYLPPPTFSYMTLLCICFSLLVVCILYKKTLLKCCWRQIKRKRKNSESFEFSLLPTDNDIENDMLNMS